eukprot:s43_g5.t1
MQSNRHTPFTLNRWQHARFMDNVLRHRDSMAECAAEMLFGRPEEGSDITRFWLRHRPPEELEVVAGGLDRRPPQEELQEEALI